MQFFSQVGAVLSAFILSSAIASPIGAASDNDVSQYTVVNPGGVNDVTITAQNTLNATANTGPSRLSAAASVTFPLAMVNGIRAGPVSAYITGLDPNGRLVFVQSNGAFYYPTAQQGSTTPQQIPNANIVIALGAYGATTSVTIPNYMSSVRVYFGVGALNFYTVYPSGASGPTLVQPSANNPQDPSAGIKWGFIEYTWNSMGLFADLSNVDFVGLVLGMALKTGNGTILNARGLRPASLQPMCNDMVTAGQNDGQPWGKLCMTNSTGGALRVLGPQDYLSISGSTKFSGYWTNYINQVFSRYASEPLTIVTPSYGNVTCTAANNAINCNGDNHSYGPPLAIDIFGCNSGPFQVYSDANGVHQEVYPRLCAAYNRATLLLAGGNVQPSLPASTYYQSEPNNVYSKYVHQLSVDGTGYAFPYDDVTPGGGIDKAGLLEDTAPQLLTVYVGGQQ